GHGHPAGERALPVRRGGGRLPQHRALRPTGRQPGAVLMMGDRTLELLSAWAIARKELQTQLRYPLQLITEVAQPLYQFLVPALLLGASFAVAGRSVGLKSMTGTENLAGYLFLGIVVGGMV